MNGTRRSRRTQRRAPTHRPEFRDLTPDEIDEVLARSHVGHLAYSVQDRRVEVIPIHYVFDDGWIYGRTSAGGKLDQLATNWWVAFAVDEVRDLFDWRSVVVHGGFYSLEPGGTERDEARYRSALAALRRLIPETLGEGDPVPFRDVVFGIAVQEKHGRMASPDGVGTT